VIELLQRTSLYGKISPSLRQYLVDTARGVIPETPKATHPAFAHVSARVIANNASALHAAANAARRSGFTATVRDQALLGDAASAGTRVADALLALRESAEPGSALCVIWGGETTVTLRLPASPGGRCQELALAAARRLAEAGDRAQGITALAAGTDGRDGTTDAAGAVVDASTWSAIGSAGRDPAAALRAHESYEALSSVNSLFKPGLTGTNVMDVVIGIVRR
jgi:glycerate-2-kinase